MYKKLGYKIKFRKVKYKNQFDLKKLGCDTMNIVQYIYYGVIYTDKYIIYDKIIKLCFIYEHSA